MMFAAVVSALMLVRAPAMNQSCSGKLVLQLSLTNVGGAFNILADAEGKVDPAHDKGLYLRGEDNGRGGWFIGVYRGVGAAPKTANLLVQNVYGTQHPNGFEIDGMNWPYYSEKVRSGVEPIIMPISGTGKCLCVRLLKATVKGAGANAGFQRGSAEFRVVEAH